MIGTQSQSYFNIPVRIFQVVILRREDGINMAKAKQLPSGTWRVQAKVTLNGRSITRSFSAPTAKAAERVADEWQKHCRMIGSDSTRMTVKEAMLSYIDMNCHRLSPSTEAEYYRIANNDMIDIIDKPLYTLTSPIIQQSIKTAMVKLSAKTVKNRYSFLKTVISVYYPDFIWAINYPKQKHPQKKAFSHTYISSIFKALAGTDFELESYLGMLSMRASEIAAVEKSEIDLKEKTLHVCRAMVKNKNKKFEVVEFNKTELSDRIIYLPDYVCNLLYKRCLETTDKYISSVPPNRYWQKLNSILKKNNIEELGFHKLRHIYSSLTSDLGIDSQIRMENGGWANEHIMNGTYRHSLSEAQKDANSKMNAYVNNMVESHTKSHTEIRKRLKMVRYVG